LAVFVLDKRQKPLMPFARKRARSLHAQQARSQLCNMVRADVTIGKKAGIGVGRLAVRACGSFNVVSVADIDWKHVCLLQRSDGCGCAVSASPVNPLNLSNLPA
jgi:hypothetical protein